MSHRLYEILAEHLSERKRKLFDQVADQRTRYITLVLEDIYQAQNTSAIQRSAESWGLQDLYVIENAHTFAHHRRIAKGANDWMDIHRFNKGKNNSKECLEQLKEKGYQIVVTTLRDDSKPLRDIDLTKKTAVVMGTELTGASETALQYADAKMVVPTYGFTESLNVAAASACILQNMTERIRREHIDWQLSPDDQLELKIKWAKKSIHWSKYLVDMYEAGEI